MKDCRLSHHLSPLVPCFLAALVWTGAPAAEHPEDDTLEPREPENHTLQRTRGRRLFYRMVSGEQNGPLLPVTRTVYGIDGAVKTSSTGMARSGFTEYPFAAGKSSYTFAEEYAYYPRIVSGVAIDPGGTNAGDIVIDHVYEPDACVWGPAGREFVQTFRASGTELASMTLLIATRPGVFRARLLEGGPGGTPVAGARTFRSGYSIEWGRARWKAGEAALEPGMTYGIRIWREDGEPFRPYLHSTGNVYDGGILYVDGRSVPESDLGAWIIEESPDITRALVPGGDGEGWVYGTTGVDFVPRSRNIRLISALLSPVVERCRDVIAHVWSGGEAGGERRLIAGPKRSVSCARPDDAYSVHFLFGEEELRVEPGETYRLELSPIPHKGELPPAGGAAPEPRDIRARFYGEPAPGALPSIHDLRARYEDDGKTVRLSWTTSAAVPVDVELLRLSPRELRSFRLAPGAGELVIRKLWRGHDHDLRLRATGPTGLVWRTPVYRLRPPGGPHPPPPPYIWEEHPPELLELAPPRLAGEPRYGPMRYRRRVALANPGFEEGLEGWTAEPRGVIVASSGDGETSPHSGQGMAGWSHRAGKEREQVFATSRMTQRVPTTAGHDYLLSARIHTSVENGPRGDTRARLVADPAGGTEFGDRNGSQWYWSDGRWLRFEHRFTATAEESTVGVELFRWRDLDRASAWVDQVMLLELGPEPMAHDTPAPSPRRPPRLALVDERDQVTERTEARVHAPAGYVITGLGARAAADNVTTLKLHARPLLEDGSLGEVEMIRAGWEPDAGLEAEIVLPDGYVATGFGARIAPEWDVKTFALRGRPLLEDGSLGEEREFRAGIEPRGGLEKEVRLHSRAGSPPRVLTSAGLRCSLNDVAGISARSAALVRTATAARRSRGAEAGTEAETETETGTETETETETEAEAETETETETTSLPEHGGSPGDLRFRHHFGDRELSGDAWGQTALADLDRDGDLDFVTGRRGGRITWYEYRAPSDWLPHILGEDSPSDVGGAALDVDRDGWIDFVAGGAWYENTGKPREEPFARHVFDEELAAVHDVVTGDLDGDGRDDVVTMSDRNDLRWYAIASDPGKSWKKTRIGPSVHSGISLGDIDGDGDLDVVRSNVWFENLGEGRRFEERRITEPWGNPKVSWQDNATRTQACDIDRDGDLDVVITDGESRGARAAWLEAPADPRKGEWKTHYLPPGDDAPRGAYHSLAVGDFDRDGDLDIFTCEMEHVGGEKPPRWFIWENADGKGAEFVERVILDRNLGGHEAVAGDVDGDGDLDICSKLWRASRKNANGGRNHFDYLENLAVE